MLAYRFHAAVKGRGIHGVRYSIKNKLSGGCSIALESAQFVLDPRVSHCPDDLFVQKDHRTVKSSRSDPIAEEPGDVPFGAHA